MFEIMDPSNIPKDRKDNNNNNNNLTNNNSNGSHNLPHRSLSPPDSKIVDKYGLRPRTIIKRIQLEKTRQEIITTKEPRKPKPPPLSKYRRKTANARERNRMKEINDAFATLRGILPSFSSRRTSTGMTKITTLKLATSYIQALSDVLREVNEQDSSPTIQTVHTNSNTINNNTKIISYSEMDKRTDIFCYQDYREHTTNNNKDIGDLFTDETVVFDGALNAFDDIPTLPETDTFSLLLSGEDTDIL